MKKKLAFHVLYPLVFLYFSTARQTEFLYIIKDDSSEEL